MLSGEGGNQGFCLDCSNRLHLLFDISNMGTAGCNSGKQTTNGKRWTVANIRWRMSSVRQYKSSHDNKSKVTCLHMLDEWSLLDRFGSSNVLLPLYSISVMWYSLNAVLIVVIISLLGSFIFGRSLFFEMPVRFLNWSIDSNDPNLIDKSLLISWKELLPCCRKNKVVPPLLYLPCSASSIR